MPVFLKKTQKGNLGGVFLIIKLIIFVYLLMTQKLQKDAYK